MPPLIRKVDCVRLYVPDLETGLAFYRNRLGHELIWRTEQSAGLYLPDTDAEIVLQVEEKRVEVEIMVAAVNEAVRLFEEAGGQIVMPPFEIQIGRCAVVQDP